MTNSSLQLKPYPSFGLPSAVSSLSVVIDRAKWQAAKSLSAVFEFSGDSANPLLLQSSTGIRRDELWRHTCFEIFLRPQGGDVYWEINVNPTGDWNVYSFTSYREGMTTEERVQNLNIKEFKVEGAKVVCRFETDFSKIEINQAIDLSATAVIELRSGEKTYWALSHAGEKPDFHLAKSFVFEIGRAK